MSIESGIEAAVLTAASAITVSDVVSLVKWVGKLAGGKDNVAAILAAEEQAMETALDIAEEVKIAQEPNP